MSGVIKDPTRKVEIGAFNNIRYITYKGRFVGATASGRFDVPYEITTPLNPREGSRTFVFEPLHFADGTIARDYELGHPFLFGRGFSHASVRHKTFRLRGLEPDPPTHLVIRGKEFPAPEVIADTEILQEFATALRQSPAFVGRVERLYAIGFSDSGNTVQDIYKTFGHKLFDITFACLARYAEPVRIQGQKPIIVFNTEADSDARAVPRPQFSQYRWYAVAGGAHIPDAALSRIVFPNPPEPGSPAPAIEGTTPINWLPFIRALFAAGDQWVRDNVQPPPSTTLKLNAEGYVMRDAKGNALGGIRHPALETGEATFLPSVVRGGWDLFGGCGFPERVPYARLTTFADYLSAFTNAADALVAARFLLPEGRDRMVEQATLHQPNTFTLNYLEGRFFAPPPDASAAGLND